MRGVPGMDDRYDKSASEDNMAWGTYFALTYTLPRKHLLAARIRRNTDNPPVDFNVQLPYEPSPKKCESEDAPG